MRKEGIANWTAEARAKSLATRRARGSVWGWDKRARALESVSSEALTKSLESLEEFDASETGIRARSNEDEMSFVDEEEYQELLAAEKRQQDSDRALEMGMMMAVGAPGITKV
jgi:hypothetical protein